MSKTLKFSKVFKKSDAPKAAAPAAKGATPATFTLQDNQNGTVTVGLVDAAGAPVAAPSTMSISAVSDNPAALTFGTGTGMTIPYNGVAPGSANATFTATDSATPPLPGSPFVSAPQPVTVTSGPATGLSVDWGTPTP